MVAFGCLPLRWARGTSIFAGAAAPRVFVSCRVPAPGQPASPPRWRAEPRRSRDPPALRPRTRLVPWEPLPALLRCEREVGVSSLPTPSCASDQPDALTEGRRRPEVRAVHRQPCLLGGTFIHSPILQMCVGPGAGSAALTQTNNVAALLEVTHSWDLETTHVLLITAALIC